MSEATAALAGFETAERAALGAALDRYAKAKAAADIAGRRLRKALEAVARAEGGRNVDPVRWSVLLTAARSQADAVSRP